MGMSRKSQDIACSLTWICPNNIEELMSKTISPVCVLSLLATIISVNQVWGQESSYSVSAMAGQFIYDSGGDKAYPHASIRLDRQLARFAEAEVSVGYSRLTTKLYSIGETIQTYDAHTPFAAVDLSLHGMVPIGRFTPYVGVSAGRLRRWEAKETYGLALYGSSVGLAGGLKVSITRKLGLRGEFRYRSDRQNGFEHRANDAEQSGGLIYRF